MTERSEQHSNVDKEIGKRIAEKRKKIPLSQAKLAKKLHISQSILAKYETGERPVVKERLIEISNLLGTNTDYLLRGIDAPNVDVFNDLHLSDEAIENIHHINDEKLTDYLNKLLESPDLIEVLDWIKTARILNNKPKGLQESNKTEQEVYRKMIQDSDGNASQYIWFSDKDQMSMSIWQASQTIGKVFRQIVKGDKDNG